MSNSRKDSQDTRQIKDHCQPSFVECMKHSLFAHTEDACKKELDECLNKTETPKLREADEEKKTDGLHMNFFSQNAPVVYKMNEHLGIRSDGTMGFYVNIGPASIDVWNNNEVSYQVKI